MILQSSKWAKGNLPEYTVSSPRIVDAQYCDVFSGWNPQIVPVVGDATYTATYERQVRYYDISFLNEDGSLLSKKSFAYGSTPTCDAPTKASEGETIYVFSGWSPAIVPVVGEATYRATFAKSVAGTAGLVYTLSSKKDSYSVTGYTGTETAVKIPSYYEGLPVTEIDEGAFKTATPVSISFPATITFIFPSAFDGASSLTTFIVDPDNATYCDDGRTILSKDKSVLWAYANGSGTSYEVPSYVKELHFLSFAGTTLKSLTLPEGLLRIGEDVFPSTLTSLSVPSTLQEIGRNNFIYALATELNGAYYYGNSQNPYVVAMSIGPTSTSSTCTLASTTLVIADRACYKESGLYHVILPSGLKHIGTMAFARSRLIDITIPDSVVSLGKNAFENCDRLEEVTLSSSLKEIPYYCFDGCTSFHEVTLPASVTAVKESAFCSCALTSVVFSEGLKTIGDSAFAHCKDLTSLNFPASLTELDLGAFSYCDALKSVTFSEGLLAIYSDSFYACSSLTSIALPASLQTFSSSAFNGCPKIQSITVSSNNSVYASDGRILTSKDQSILYFYAPASGTSYVVPSQVVSINSCAFYGVSSLTSVKFQEGLQEIGSSAFESCSGLQSIVTPDSLTTIGEGAFRNCTALTSLNLGKNLTSFATEDAFRGCKAFQQFILSSENSAFWTDGPALYNHDQTTLLLYAYYSGTSYAVNEHATSIGDYAFYNDSDLTALNIPLSVTSIGAYGIYGLTKLATINYPGTKKQWYSIGKGESWTTRHDINVVCSDGTITV